MACNRAGRVELIPNREGQNQTPCAVWLSPDGKCVAGQRAKNALVTDSANVQLDFVRNLGSSAANEFPRTSSRVKPEELTAELLKSLRADAEQFIGQEIRSAVITVPTDAGLAQCEATKRAASTAGFVDCLLIQDAVAAALAANVTDDAGDKTVLTYDFGGGRFSAAVLRTHDGLLQVVAHAGDLFLGGTNLDRTVVESVFVPALQATHLDLDLSARGPRAHELFVKLQAEAEAAKLRLSSTLETSGFVPNLCQDASAHPVDFSYELTRAQLETLAAQFIDHSINICRQVLAEARLTPADLDDVIPVGGMATMPFVQQRLREWFGRQLPSSSLDPSATVAYGAAIFSGSQHRPKATAPAPSAPSMESTHGFDFDSDCLRILDTASMYSGGTGVVGTIHIFAAMLNADAGHICGILAQQGVSSEALLAAFRASFGSSSARASSAPTFQFSANAQRVLEIARRSAKAGKRKIGSYDLLRAFVAQAGETGRILRQAGVDLQRLVAAGDSHSRAARPPSFAGLGQRLDRNAAPTGEEDITPSQSSTPSPNPPRVDANVQFTVFRPLVVAPKKWYPLLAFAHLSERPPDAPADDPDPLEEVRRQAHQVLGEQLQDYSQVAQDSTEAVPAAGEITFLPEIAGVEFNPSRATFLWLESVHRQDFRLRAKPELDGQTARGRLTVFLGTRIVADVPLAIRVGTPAQKQPHNTGMVSARPYRRVFASYSRKDLAVVEEFESYVAAFGDQYLRDAVTLRAGEVWNDRLAEMIREADVFQLFWSSNSMRSQFVRQEWEHALSLCRSHFVRPVYWEEPLPEDSSQGLPPDALRRLHFQWLRRPSPTSAEEDASRDGTRSDNATELKAESVVGAFTAPLPAPAKGASPRISCNVDVLISSLASQLVGSREEAIQQMLKTARDEARRGVSRSTETTERGRGRVRLTWNPKIWELTIEDDGCGRHIEEVETQLESFGRAFNSPVSSAELVGQFGMGFLTGLTLGSEIHMFTCVRGDNSGVHLLLTGDGFQIEPWQAEGFSGTRWVIKTSPETRDWLGQIPWNTFNSMIHRASADSRDVEWVLSEAQGLTMTWPRTH